MSTNSWIVEWKNSVQGSISFKANNCILFYTCYILMESWTNKCHLYLLPYFPKCNAIFNCGEFVKHELCRTIICMCLSLFKIYFMNFNWRILLHRAWLSHGPENGQISGERGCSFKKIVPKAKIKSKMYNICQHNSLQGS